MTIPMEQITLHKGTVLDVPEVAKYMASELGKSFDLYTTGADRAEVEKVLQSIITDVFGEGWDHLKVKREDCLTELMSIRMALYDPQDSRMVELAKKNVDVLIRREFPKE